MKKSENGLVDIKIPNFHDLSLYYQSVFIKMLKELKTKAPKFIYDGIEKYYNVTKTDLTKIQTVNKVPKLVKQIKANADLKEGLLEFVYTGQRKPVLAENDNQDVNSVLIKKQAKQWNMKSEKKKGVRAADFIWGHGYRNVKVKTDKKTGTATITKERLNFLAYSEKTQKYVSRTQSGKLKKRTWKMHVYKALSVPQMITNEEARKYRNEQINKIISKYFPG